MSNVKESSTTVIICPVCVSGCVRTRNPETPEFTCPVATAFSALTATGPKYCDTPAIDAASIVNSINTAIILFHENSIFLSLFIKPP